MTIAFPSVSTNAWSLRIFTGMARVAPRRCRLAQSARSPARTELCTIIVGAPDFRK
jgi:hypothetical protein